jgi:hypothetical protein
MVVLSWKLNGFKGQIKCNLVQKEKNIDLGEQMRI